MNLKATADNVIIKVKKKKKDPSQLLVQTDDQEQVLLGDIVSAGPKVHAKTSESKGIVCVYLNRIAILPWETDDHNFYVTKEENIYGILEL